jgi:hypothetical protein
VGSLLELDDGLAIRFEAFVIVFLRFGVFGLFGLTHELVTIRNPLLVGLFSLSHNCGSIRAGCCHLPSLKGGSFQPVTDVQQ